MGFSITASHLLWGLALFGAAGGAIAASFTMEHANVSGNDALAHRARDATLTRARGTFCYNGTAQTLAITALNAGDTAISLGNTTLILDGVFHASPTWTLVGAAATTDAWLPHETATATLSGQASAPTRVSLALPTGTLSFLRAACG